MGALTDDGSEPTPESIAQFSEFFSNTLADLVRRLMIFGATWTEANDACNEAMVEVHLRWTEIDEPRAYARRASLTNFLAIKRAAKRWRRLRVRLATCHEPVDAGNLWMNADVVRQILAVLPPAQRRVLALTVDGYDAAEIAELLGCTPDAVRQNLRRARSRLQVDPFVNAEYRRRLTPPKARRTRSKADVPDVASTDTEPTGGEPA
jgi:RNA polymerase sigma factor (sigma-70 family)